MYTSRNIFFVKYPVEERKETKKTDFWIKFVLGVKNKNKAKICTFQAFLKPFRNLKFQSRLFARNMQKFGLWLENVKAEFIKTIILVWDRFFYNKHYKTFLMCLILEKNI